MSRGGPAICTWSVLGLSGNIVTIVLMASLLASLHYVLVLLALGAAGLSLALERQVNSRLYEFFYKETPEEREREYMGDLLAQSRTTKEIRAYVLADYLLGRHRDISEALFEQREQHVPLGHAHLDADGPRHRDRARPGVFVRRREGHRRFT